LQGFKTLAKVNLSQQSKISTMEKLMIIRKLILGLPLSEAEFKIRGFEEGFPAQNRLELVAKTVVNGYNIALETGLSKSLSIAIAQVTNELIGFFHEGVAMGLFTLDLFSIGNKNRLYDFIEGEGRNHAYMSYIGAGIASAIFRNNNFEYFTSKANSEGESLFLNGIGFYNAYFKPKKTLKEMFIPKSFAGKEAYFVEGYDNGIGRAVWFYNSGEPTKIFETVNAFPPERQGAVWAGIGLAATYAGGVSEEKIHLLKRLSGKYAYRLGEGSFLATHTRRLAGNPHPTDTTERILTGRSSEECHEFATEIIEKTLRGEKYINGEPSFQLFLSIIRDWVIANQTATVYA
jgi:enediyne biosynthesis protein E3